RTRCERVRAGFPNPGPYPHTHAARNRRAPGFSPIDRFDARMQGACRRASNNEWSDEFHP
ncbi:hypothetical protein, partial [Burkholderia ubonensis]|uniref:hypothetical protein n=1 Tax=Burkholderia ubonensis TaxID=101571 RepID=UPI001E54561A